MKIKILNLLKELGYLRYKYLKETIKDNTKLTFDIDLGEKAIKKISFIENKIYKNQKLKRVIVSEEYKFEIFIKIFK